MNEIPALPWGLPLLLGFTGSDVDCCSATQLCPTLWDPMSCSMPGFPVLHHLLELAQTPVHWVSDAIQPSHPLLFLLLLPLIFPSIRIFSNESVLRIRWPNHWSFSFSISLSSEYSGLISFRIDWLDLLAVQGTLNSRLQHQDNLCSPVFSFLSCTHVVWIHSVCIWLSTTPWTVARQGPLSMRFPRQEY